MTKPAVTRISDSHYAKPEAKAPELKLVKPEPRLKPARRKLREKVQSEIAVDDDEMWDNVPI